MDSQKIYDRKATLGEYQPFTAETMNVFKKGIGLLFALIFLLFLTACGATNTGNIEEGLPPEAVLEAQAWLAEQLNVALEEVEIVSSEQVEWTDSCFGLGGPAESCAAVITPGWRTIFEIDGQEYEVRFGETGTPARSPQIP